MAGEKKIFVDTETTGFHRELDQVLEIALLVEDAQRNQIDSLEIKIKLKENVIPDAKALLVNKINPYSKEWIAEAVTEYEAANLVAAFVKKHQGPGGLKKPVLVAYNADFDKPVVSVFLSRGGHKFKQLFNRSVSDPLITARKLIASGKLKTVEKTFNFRTTQSAKLGDVAAARGITFDGEAHRALTDTKVLQKLTPILFDEAAGLKTGTLLSEPSTYQAGQILNLVTDSKSSGVSVRHVYVLENNPDDEFVVVIDQKDLDENKGFKPSAIRQFNYATILGETEVQSDVAESLRTIAIERADAITPLVKKKHKDSGEEPDYHDEGVEFVEIERLQSLMTDADDKRAMFNRLSDELMDRFGGDKAKTKSVMNRVEQVACAKGLKGWMRDLFYDDRIRLLEHIAGSTTVRVALNPAGNYDVAIAFERGGKRFQERTSCKATKDIQNFLNGKIGKVPEFVEFVGAIPDSDEFKDPKHPSVQIKMLTDAIDEIKVADKNSETSPPKGEAFSESTKAAVTQIIMQFKQLSPKIFSQLKPQTANADEINDQHYWKSGDQSSVPVPDFIISSDEELDEVVATLPLKDRPLAPLSNVKSHVRPGDKLSKTPCALCGRPLSAEISIQHSIGPTCRKNLQFAEESTGVLAPYRDNFRPFVLSAAPDAGDLVAIRFKDHLGQTAEMLAEFVSVTPAQVQVIDRRKVKALLKAGLNPNFAMFLSTNKFGPGSISGIARLKPTVSIEDSRDHAEDET